MKKKLAFLYKWFFVLNTSLFYFSFERGLFA